VILKKAFSVAKELKFNGIEISLTDPKEISVSELKDLVNKYQINVSAIATGGAAVRDGLNIFFSGKIQYIRRKNPFIIILKIM
jgi:hypothetical protein